MKRREEGVGFWREEEEEDEDIILRRESKGVSKLGEGNILLFFLLLFSREGL